MNYRRFAVCLAPFLLLSVALLWVREKRSWLPSTVSLSIGGTQSFGLGGVAWCGDNLWIFNTRYFPAPRNKVFAPEARDEFRLIDGVRLWTNNGRPTPSVDLGLTDVSEDGKTIAFTFQNPLESVLRLQSIGVWRDGKSFNLVEERPLRGTEEDGNALVKIAPDARFLAATSRFKEEKQLSSGYSFAFNRIVIYNLQTRRPSAFCVGDSGVFTDFEWSPNGQKIAAITGMGWAFLFDARTGKRLKKWRAHDLFGAQIAWSHDGKQLATASDSRLYTTQTGVEIVFPTGERIWGTGTIRESNGPTKTLLPDARGELRFNGKTDRSLKFFDANTSRQIGKSLVLGGCTDLKFSPDDRFLAVGSHDEAFIFNAQTRSFARRLGPEKRVMRIGTMPLPHFLDWNARGDYLAVSDSQNLTFWRVR